MDEAIAVNAISEALYDLVVTTAVPCGVDTLLLVVVPIEAFITESAPSIAASICSLSACFFVLS